MVSCRAELDKSLSNGSRPSTDPRPRGAFDRGILTPVPPPSSRPASPSDPDRTWRVAPHPVDAPASQALLLRYHTEVSDRFYGRPTPPEVLAAGFAAQDSTGLSAPRGTFLVVREGDGDTARWVGCAGVELVPTASEPTAELRRVFVDPASRGRGMATALLDAAEAAARELGAVVVRLDTRHDLVEALGLYAKRGYVDVPAFNADPYAQRWLARRL